MDASPQPLALGDRDRLTALEERLTFQQRLIDELNQAILAQGVDISRLQRELAQCQSAMERLAADGGEGDLPHEKPPHY